jgi:glycosyltransferase involved in cell wall biosynthesis
VTLVDNLVDRDGFAGVCWRPAGRPGSLRLAYFGWIIREKGLFELLGALGSVPAASVDLYGPQVRPDEFASLMAAARDRGLDSRFVYRGQVPHHDVAARMSAYDAVILPSHGESFGLVAAEAMSVGVPVIGSRVGFLWDAPDEVAERLPDVSAKAIARTLARLLDDPARLQLLSAGGRAYSAAFNADRIMPVWQNLYRSIVDRSGGTQEPGGGRR